MNLFKKLFSGKSTENLKVLPVKIGYYTDRNKTKFQLDAWENAMKLYEENKFFDAYWEFFNYLCDTKINNIFFSRENDTISFEILQGSNRLKGFINQKDIYVEAEIAKLNSSSIGAMRKVLNQNYHLWYSRFGLKDNSIFLLYNGSAGHLEVSSLYYVLKEMAIYSDIYDDTLPYDFSELEPIYLQRITPLSDKEFDIKIKFLRKWIDDAFEKIEKWEKDHFSSAISYKLLSTVFKIGYLISPEGFLARELEWTQNIFYDEDKQTNQDGRNYEMMEKLTKIKEMSVETLRKAMYSGKSTFSTMRATKHEQIAKFINDELPKTIWYRRNQYPEIQQTIYEYIVSYACFQYGLHQTEYQLLNILWEVLYTDYFQELGASNGYFDPKTEKFSTSKIESKIKSIINESKHEYTELNFNTRRLNYSSLLMFAESFLIEFAELNYN